MSTTPIVTIPVDDSGFKRFTAAFEEYLSKLKHASADWQKAHVHIEDVAGAMENVGASAATAEKTWSKIVDTAQESAGAVTEVEKAWTKTTQAVTNYHLMVLQTVGATATAQKSLGHATDSASSAMARMERHAKNIASDLFSAVRSMAKFATFGLGGGLLGLGGLTFGLDRLADAVLNKQRTARGLGITVGELNSFQANFARVAGTNVLTGAALAQIQPQDWGFLAALGINPQTAQSESATALAGQEMLAVHRAWQRNPTLLSAAAISAEHLGMSPEDIRRIGNTPLATLQADITATRQDAPALGFSAQVARDWANFSIQLHKAGIRIESALITALAPLTPQLGLLSKNLAAFIVGLEKSGEVKRWVDALAGGIHDFAVWLGSPAFKSDMRTFAADISALASAAQNALRWFGLIPKAEPSHQEFATAFGQKPVGGATGFMNRLGQNAEIRGQRLEGAYAPTNLHTLAQKYGAQYNLPPGVLDRLLMVESGYGKNLVSPAGALGPAQLMPGTATLLNVDPLNAAQNVRGGAEYLADQLAHYGDLRKAIAAYNAGPGAVDAAIKAYGQDWLAHMPAETQREVAAIAGSGAGATDARVAAALAKAAVKPAPAAFPHSFGVAPGPVSLARGTLPAPTPAPVAAPNLPPGMAGIMRMSDMASVRSRYWQTQHGVRVKVENNTGAQTYVSANGAAQ